MANEASQQEIAINIKGPNELKLQITISTDKTVLELKQAIAAQSNVEAERQRLIYSGRVLKDEDHLSTYKIQSSHTIHMVKGVARSGGPSSQPSPPQQLPTMQAGQNPHDPLTLLNSHLGFGAMAGINPFAELGLNTNDPNMFQTMINSPQFMQQMSSLLANPEIVDQLIASNPQLASMGPHVRAAFQSPHFRELLSNPERLQQMMQLTAALRQAGFNPLSPDPSGGSALFPPGFSTPNALNNTSSTTTTDTTPSTGSQTQQSQGQTPGSPGITSTATGTTQPQPFNLFAAAAGARGSPASGAAGTRAGTGQQPLSPFGPMDPALIQQLMAMSSLGGSGGLGGGLGGLGGLGGGLGGLGELGGVPATPADTRPPEERFEAQLRQLQEMGFTNAAQNIRALQATGGNVQSAIDYILGGGGLP